MKTNLALVSWPRGWLSLLMYLTFDQNFWFYPEGSGSFFFFFSLLETAVLVEFSPKGLFCGGWCCVHSSSMHTLQSVSIISELLKAKLGMAMQMYDCPLSCLYQPLFTARPFPFPIPPHASWPSWADASCICFIFCLLSSLLPPLLGTFLYCSSLCLRTVPTSADVDIFHCPRT